MAAEGSRQKDVDLEVCVTAVAGQTLEWKLVNRLSPPRSTE
jgi:hypothetical protein